MPRKIVAAMSGGVDSAVAAYLLKEQGFDVIGITLRLAPENAEEARSGRCCSLDDMSDARLVCDKIGIPFYAIDAQAKFKETVFDPFVRAYQRGITPIPCLACNHTVKFGDLFKTAKNLGAGLATGHYARIVDYQGQKTIGRPYDRDRDQTYYLYGTDPAILNDLYFPLGELQKPEVRAIARSIGLLVHDKKDSHEICFVPDGNHARVVEKALGKPLSGDIVDADGKKLGHHEGVHHFTVGQRRGLGVSGKDRLFVADIDAENNRVVLAQRDSLKCSRVLVNQFSYIMPRTLWPEKVAVKIRARSAEMPATLIRNGEEGREIEFVFDEPVLGVALGQAAVVYDGDVMLGGGLLAGRLDGAFMRCSSKDIEL